MSMAFHPALVVVIWFGISPTPQQVVDPRPGKPDDQELANLVCLLLELRHSGCDQPGDGLLMPLLRPLLKNAFLI